jgi:hypothetical protein
MDLQETSQEWLLAKTSSNLTDRSTIVNAFDTAWHPGLLCKLHKLNFSINLIKLIISFLSERKFTVSVEGEMSTHRKIQAGVPEGSILSPTLYNMYINVTPPPEHYVFIFPSLPMILVCTSMPQVAKKVMFSESCSASSVQLRRGVSAGTKMSEDKTLAVYFSQT